MVTRRRQAVAGSARFLLLSGRWNYRAGGAVPGSDEEARARFGDYFAEVLLLDQGTAAAKIRDELGWRPTRASLAAEFRHGSYRH